jgi:transcriptional regulator with XRE-family HTH domain
MSNKKLTLNEKLAKLRKKKEVSLQTVANQIGISKAHVHDLEKGSSKNPTMSLLSALADYYDVTIDYLAGREDKVKAPDEAISYDELNDIVLSTSERIEKDSGKTLSSNQRQKLNDKLTEFCESADIEIYDESDY